MSKALKIDEWLFEDLEEDFSRDFFHRRDLTKPAISEIYKGIVDQESSLKTLRQTLKDSEIDLEKDERELGFLL